MKTKILTRSSDLNEILLAKLNQVGLTGETIDYNRPLSPQLLDAEVLVTGFSNIDKTIIDSCPNLKLVHQTGIGVDNVDVGYCTSKSIFVANVPLANAVSVAEYTLFLILYLAKNLKAISSTTRPSLLERRVAGILGSEVQGKSLTIAGLGATGLEVAK